MNGPNNERMPFTGKEGYVVWVDDKEKTVSFRPLEKGEKKVFIDHDEFLTYLEALVSEFYLFG